MTLRRDWNEREHPRWPDGAPGGKGGEFRDKGAPGGDWAARIADAMIAPRATALKPAKPARRAPASKLKPGQVRQVGLPEGYEMFEGTPDYKGQPTWDVRTVDGEYAFTVEHATETRDKLQGRIAVSRKTVAGFKAVISREQNEQFDIRDSRSYHTPTSRAFYTDSRGLLASTRKQAVEDGVRMHRQLYITRGERKMRADGIEQVDDRDLDMIADYGIWPSNQEARKERERRAAAKEPEMVEIPIRGGDSLLVERSKKEAVPTRIQEATDRFQRGEIDAAELARILEGREDAPLPKLTPAAAKFLAEYQTNSRLNAGERVPIQLTKNGLVRVRTGKNGLGMKERWLELTPEGRRVKLALETAPPPTPKKAAAPKLRKSLRPGDRVEWFDEQDGTTLQGTVRREGRFTMVDWEGGRSEKVSARGTDPSIRKVADAPSDYVQPEADAPRINLDSVMKQADLTFDHNYTNRSAYLAIQSAKERLRQGTSAKEVAAWLRQRATGLTSDEDDQTSKVQMDRETLRERVKAGKRLLRELATALVAYRPAEDWASRVSSSIRRPGG